MRLLVRPAATFSCLALAACATGSMVDPATSLDAGGSAPPGSDAAHPSVDAGRRLDASIGVRGDAAPDGGVEGDDDGGAVGPATVTVDAGLPANLRVLDEANGILTSLKQTQYDHHTFIDEATGTYDVDCSGFVNFVLEQAVPPAFTTLVASTATRPLAEDYVLFIMRLRPSGYPPWHRVDTAMSLVAGDIVSWDEPKVLHSTDTGHVMIVAAPPVLVAGEVDVLVIDAASSGHGTTDLRTVHDATGVGEGTVVLLVDANGAPTGFRWSTDPGEIAYTTPVELGHLE